ncbi:peptide chain release factor-like protein [Candidatus Peregrinibacteria bacterium]|jgi:protein subunit release factor B|nr:peptide chain release factor-like protein [Candidatus Peregrinibacteria bacterium]MBT3598761.1 peptide chain release factor-like protein [Candidatus Peregrinibacteria bacterium]MBT4367571.1 peptide chain release factor-like protein [Candidatus Peregrinibacteria bacterium]MBT4585829.1 peptide chain release factor-like protein [Candidatus Peregrinibacteria bacterium]MBT6731229.1 peptide chain release factor-like protein [Candidatus Peregrinibacteria bacterium]
MDFPIELPAKHLDLANELNIDPSDIEEVFTKGGGPGGQKVNKTSSCVELFHKPTGITVRVQRHREQSRNRTSAYKLLIMKVEEKIRGKRSERAKRIFKLRKQKMRRSRKSKEKMLEQKHRRSDIKEGRKSVI